jgi:hypothetical protein
MARPGGFPEGRPGYGPPGKKRPRKKRSREGRCREERAHPDRQGRRLLRGAQLLGTGTTHDRAARSARANRTASGHRAQGCRGTCCQWLTAREHRAAPARRCTAWPTRHLAPRPVGRRDRTIRPPRPWYARPSRHGTWHAWPSRYGGWHARPSRHGAWYAWPSWRGAWHAWPSRRGGWYARPSRYGGWHARPSRRGGWHARPSRYGGWHARPSHHGAWHARPGSRRGRAPRVA